MSLSQPMRRIDSSELFRYSGSLSAETGVLTFKAKVLSAVLAGNYI